MFTIYFWRNYDEAPPLLIDSEMQSGSACLFVCACVSLCMWVWQECVVMVVYNFQKSFPNCLATADWSERLLNPFFKKVSSVYTQFFRRIGGVLFAPIRQWHCSESVHGLSVSISLMGIASLPLTARFRTFKWAITSQHQHKSRIQFGRLKITRRKDLKFLAKQIQEREHCWVKASESHLFTVFRKKKKHKISNSTLMILTVFKKMFPDALRYLEYKKVFFCDWSSTSNLLSVCKVVGEIRGYCTLSETRLCNMEQDEPINHSLSLNNDLPKVLSVKGQWYFLKYAVSFAIGVAQFPRDQAELIGRQGYQGSANLLSEAAPGMWLVWSREILLICGWFFMTNK